MDRLPGFRDFLPAPAVGKDQWELDARRYLFDTWRRVAMNYGFREYDGPPLEPLELLTKKSGEEIVGQLYNFEDKGGRAVSLRPEMTPTLARLIAGNERQYKKPMKWFSIPQLFRYERQQKGRLREHFQLNADIIGEGQIGADAEIIALLIDVLRALGLQADDLVVRLSSRDAWQAFFREHGGKAEDEYAFFQVVDKLERTPDDVSQERLAALGLSLEAVKQFIEAGTPTDTLAELLGNLQARGMGDFVRVDYGVIRGLAYYTGTVFEAFDRKGEFRAIAGGGRYDELIGLISNGKTRLPALGFGMGDVVLMELLRVRGVLPEWPAPVEVYCLIEDEAQREASLKLIQSLRAAGLRVDFPLAPLKGNKQFKHAQELGARITVALAPRDGDAARIRVKHLADRSETAATWENCVKVVQEILAS